MTTKQLTTFAAVLLYCKSIIANAIRLLTVCSYSYCVAGDYHGLADEYANSSSVCTVRLALSSTGQYELVRINCLTDESVDSSAVVKLLGNNRATGTWVVLLGEKGSDGTASVRVTSDDENSSLMAYLSELKHFIDRKQDIPLSVYHRFLRSKHSAISRDARNCLFSADPTALDLFAQGLTLKTLADELQTSDDSAAELARIYIVLIGHSKVNDASERISLLDRLLVTSVRGEWPGQAQNLDALIASIIACDSQAGLNRVQKLLSSPSANYEMHRKIIRAIKFAIGKHQLSEIDIFVSLRENIDHLEGIYSEFIELAYLSHVQLTPSEVIRMCEQAFETKSYLTPTCKRTIAEYYWVQSKDWRRQFLFKLSKANDSLSKEILLSVCQLDGAEHLLRVRFEKSLLRSDAGEACVLGSQIEDRGSDPVSPR